MLAVLLVIKTNLYVFLLIFTVTIVLLWLARRGKSAKVVLDKKDDKFSIPHVQNFSFSEGDGNLAVSLGNKDFSIRIKNLSSEKDIKDFSLSLSCFTNTGNSEMEGLKIILPQIKKITLLDNHTVRIEKSSAANWKDIEAEILVYLFKFLDKKYGWRYKKQVVRIEEVKNNNVLKFNLRIQTKYCITLGKALHEIEGISGSNKHHLYMDKDHNYDFNLEKSSSYSWEELRPEIEKAFTSFFPKGVTFIGIWESKNK